jgi:maltose O-acetyltransferase
MSHFIKLLMMFQILCGDIKQPIHIADYAWIATNAIILPGVKIGRGAVLVGAVVSKDNCRLFYCIGNLAKAIHKKKNLEL